MVGDSSEATYVFRSMFLTAVIHFDISFNFEIFQVTLNVYSFENVYYHVMHERIPAYAIKALSYWFSKSTPYYRLLLFSYYLKMFWMDLIAPQGQHYAK